VQTDNSFLSKKIFLRRHFLSNKNVNVLNCYAGSNKIWNEIKLKTEAEINVLNIDKKNYSDNLKGDNLKFLMGMDLS